MFGAECRFTVAFQTQRQPTKVGVRIYIIDVDGVDSEKQNFSASVYFEARWKSPLLQHEGPGPKIQRTTSIWTRKRPASPTLRMF
jgi:hypothetical protein